MEIILEENLKEIEQGDVLKYDNQEVVVVWCDHSKNYYLVWPVAWAVLAVFESLKDIKDARLPYLGKLKTSK